MKNSVHCAFAVLASLAVAACSTSDTGEVSAPTTVTPAPVTPAPADVATETELAADVVTALTLDEDDTLSGIAVMTAIEGAAGAPVLTDDTYTVDGVEYTLIEQEDTTLETGDLFAVEVASVDGVMAIGVGEFGVFNDQGSDADRIDILFSEAPTEVSNLPTSTANYVGTFSGIFFDVQDQDSLREDGIFTATADFGADQSVTGGFYAENADGTQGEHHGELIADISGNTFTGVINNNIGHPSNTDEQISAAGFFGGANAERIVGAGAGTFNHGPNDSQDALIVFEGTAE